LEDITPDKPQHLMDRATPSDNSKQISSINMQYQSPIQVADYSMSKIMIGSCKRNLSSVKTTKHQNKAKNNFPVQPYFKFRSKSCEKNQKEEKYFIFLRNVHGINFRIEENESFRNYVQVQNWHLNNFQR
jgi:hypothetical protein